MSDTEEIDMISQKEEENITSTKRTAVIKREKEKLEEKQDEDELEKELDGADNLAEDSDQEYTTKKKKVGKKNEPIVDSAFQSRLVRKDYSLFFSGFSRKLCSFLSHLERRSSEEI